MTEPRVWTMIGLMAGVFFGTMTHSLGVFTPASRSEIGGLRGESRYGDRWPADPRWSFASMRSTPASAREIRFNGVDAHRQPWTATSISS